MPVTLGGRTFYRTAEVCRMAGISRNTLFRWLREGGVSSVEHRDYRGWRLFTRDQIDAIKEKNRRVVTIHLAKTAGILNSSALSAGQLLQQKGNRQKKFLGAEDSCRSDDTGHL